MNLSAVITLALIGALSILIFWESERILTALLVGLGIFGVYQWKGTN